MLKECENGVKVLIVNNNNRYFICEFRMLV